MENSCRTLCLHREQGRKLRNDWSDNLLSRGSKRYAITTRVGQAWSQSYSFAENLRGKKRGGGCGCQGEKLNECLTVKFSVTG